MIHLFIAMLLLQAMEIIYNIPYDVNDGQWTHILLYTVLIYLEILRKK
jgi:hypothetical protein